MNRLSLAMAALTATALTGAASAATMYPDATGEVVVPGGPYPHLDISSVEVSNDAANLYIKVTTVGDPLAPNWGKYMVGIDTAGGGSPTSNGWGRPISMSSGMDYWVGSWVDTSPAGSELWRWDGAAWPLQLATYNNNMTNPSVTGNEITLTVPLAAMGLVHGSPILFDVYSSGGGGGDGATDALSAAGASIANWGDAFSTQSPLAYTVVIPEPMSLSLAVLGGLALIRRRK